MQYQWYGLSMVHPCKLTNYLLRSPRVDPVELRSRIGMVFQKPNPFPKSIFDNVAFGLKVNGINDHISDRVERSLRRTAIWDEVKDRLNRAPCNSPVDSSSASASPGPWPLSRR